MQTAVDMEPAKPWLLGGNLQFTETQLLKMCMERLNSGNSYTVISIYMSI